MDIVGKETLENMLAEYKGTVIFVSHDRYFVNKVADKILAFEPDGAKFYPFGYAEYDLVQMERQQELEKTLAIKSDVATPTGAKKTFSTPLKDRTKKEKRVEKLSQTITSLEDKLKSLNDELSLPEVYSDYEKITKIQDEISIINSQIEDLTLEWLTLSEELENL
jgi:ATP-binding cassette subfamily F protein 3